MSGWRNGKSAASRAVGETRVLASSSSWAISPITSRATGPGRGKIVGRRRARPRAFVNSALVSASGATACEQRCGQRCEQRCEYYV